jgi:hypothetical protein
MVSFSARKNSNHSPPIGRAVFSAGVERQVEESGIKMFQIRYVPLAQRRQVFFVHHRGDDIISGHNNVVN